MKTLENQTIYQCEYCNKRFLSKQGVKKHEEQYCYKSPVPKQKRQEKIMSCKHEWEETYSYIPGEAVMQPESYQCKHCGVDKYVWQRIVKEGTEWLRL